MGFQTGTARPSKALDELKAETMAKAAKKSEATMRPDQVPALMAMADVRLLETIRKRVERMVHDQKTVKSLQCNSGPLPCASGRS